MSQLIHRFVAETISVHKLRCSGMQEAQFSVFSSLAELNLYSGPQFHQVTETQSQSALTNCPLGLCLQNARWGAIWPSVSSAIYPCWHPLRLPPPSLVCGHWSLQVATTAPLSSFQGHIRPAGSLCIFHWGNFACLHCSRLRKTL